MTHLQEEFLSELKSKEKLTVSEYAQLYKKHSELAIEYEKNNGANKYESEAMGNYYTISVLSDFVKSENKLARIIALEESTKSK